MGHHVNDARIEHGTSNMLSAAINTLQIASLDLDTLTSPVLDHTGTTGKVMYDLWSHLMMLVYIHVPNHMPPGPQ